MRSFRDRIRHAVSFEIIGLVIVTPLGAWAFNMPMHSIGIVSLIGASIATAWNYVFNLGFDHAMLRLRGDMRKTPLIRMIHALTFESGLLLILLPFIAWQLGMTLAAALVVDISFAGFYVVYAFVFNWAYDVVFPIPNPSGRSRASVG